MATMLDVRPPSVCIASSSYSSIFGPRSGLTLHSAPKFGKASSIAARCSASSILVHTGKTGRCEGPAQQRDEAALAVFAAGRKQAQAPEEQVSNISRHIACGLCAAATALNLWSSIPLASAAVRLPPLSTDPNRCEKAFVGNTIGQANGVADKLLDLRFCDYTNDKSNLKGKTLSAALMSDAKFDGADMTEVTMSKAYAVGASFKGADFTNAILDRVAFDGSNLQGANFKNAVLSGSTFVDAKLEDSNFEDALIGYVDLQKLCRNTSLPADAKATLGCKS